MAISKHARLLNAYKIIDQHGGSTDEEYWRNPTPSMSNQVMPITVTSARGD